MMRCDNCNKREATRTTGYPKPEFEEYHHWCDECYGQVWIMDYIDYDLNRHIDAWKTEIKELNEGLCGTLWTDDTIPYRESKI